MGDPAAVATLVVLRSAGGEGAVTLGWQLEDQATDDLTPLKGTLVFTQVQHEADSVTVPPHLDSFFFFLLSLNASVCNLNISNSHSLIFCLHPLYLALVFMNPATLFVLYRMNP